jgi:hypothetical protein
VDGCPVVIQPGPIIPDPCIGICNPCFGGINVPASSARKSKCCEPVTYECGLIPREKSSSEWIKPGSTNSSNCGCCNRCH